MEGAHVKRRYLALTLLIGAAWAAPAEAHLVNTGLGPIYDGLTHVALSPDDLLPVIAMALLAGLNGATAGRRAMFVLTGSWLTGGLVGFASAVAVVPAIAPAIAILVLGLLTAADRRSSPPIVTVLAGALGLAHGWRNGAGLAVAELEPLGLVGITSAVFVITALVAAMVVSLRPAWSRIAVRVAGSWLAAIGLLMIGWSLRG